MTGQHSPAKLGLTDKEIFQLVYDYIGVEEGHLNHFTYRFHDEFYGRYCGLTVDVPGLRKKHGTTRETFLAIIREASPEDQARIAEGVLEYLPVEKIGSPDGGRKAARSALLGAVARIRGQGVATGNLSEASESVKRALLDAAVLIERNGNVSGIDRVHTALHGYLRTLCAIQGVAVPDDADAVKLFRLLRDGVPALKPAGPRQADITKIQNAFATVLDALRPIRNQASLAHPNEDLLNVEEASLAIDASRTLLNYLDRKLSKH